MQTHTHRLTEMYAPTHALKKMDEINGGLYMVMKLRWVSVSKHLTKMFRVKGWVVYGGDIFHGVKQAHR